MKDEEIMAWTDAAPPREPEHRGLALAVFVALPVALSLLGWALR